MKLHCLFIVIVTTIFFLFSKSLWAENCKDKQQEVLSVTELSSIQTKARAGDARAQVQLGMAYLYGEGVEFNIDKGLSLLEKSAIAGDKKGQYLLGRYLLLKGKTEEDFKKSSGWLKQSADQGCIPALFYFGLLMKEGKGGITKDVAGGIQMIVEAAKAKNTLAQTWLGILYVTGDGVSKDEETGFNWIKKAANSGSSFSQLTLANLYLIGKGTEKNPEKAISLLEKVYAKNDEQAPMAAYFLGQIHMDGKGVPVDIINAFRWMIVAANADITGSKEKFKILTEQLTKQKLATACSVYMDPSFATNGTKEYMRVDSGETVALLFAYSTSNEVYFPDRRLLGYIPLHCLDTKRNGDN